MRKYIILIIIFVAVAYGNTLFNNFVGDDNYTVYKNAFITSWKNLPSVFSKQYLSTSDNIVLNSYHRKEYGAGEITYRPVATLSYMLDYSSWKLNAFGYHLTNLLLHTLNAILVYVFVLLLAKNNPLAFFSGLIFGAHPLATEAVNSISAREELLVVFFLLSAFILFIHYKRQSGLKKNLLYPASCLLFFLGLFSKETAIVFPALIMLYDFLFEFNCEIKKVFSNFKRYAGYISIAIFYLVIYFFVFSPQVQKSIPYANGSLYTQFLTIAVIFSRYISTFLAPLNVAIIPSFYYPLVKSILDYEVFISILFLFLLVVGVIKSYRRSRPIFFAMLWFFIAILPVSNIFFRLANMFALRYVYFPLVGLSIAAAIVIMKFVNFPAIKKISPSADKVVMLFVVGLCIAVTVPQNIAWRNDFTFGQNQVAYYPYIAEPYQAIAKHYFERGYFQKSIDNLKMSLKYKPIDSLSYNDMGVCYFELGMFDEAVKALNIAIQIRPDFIEAHYNLGIIYLNKKDFHKAAEFFEKTIKFDPLYTEAYNNLAVSYIQIDRREDAIKMFEKALEISPHHELVEANLKALTESLQEKN
ncbi:MAG: tetratricopeptide repeat protein [Candidatus Omnitrophica bacterium]|nr:tetratricopeptide repeat protein [Candidatus Omnitrophota bacterium]